jgi:HK97 family phage major capsid protein/HK97 family phage prohead protease
MRTPDPPVLEDRNQPTLTEDRTALVDVRDARVQGNTLHGFAAVYGVPSEPIEDRRLSPRPFREVIERGAFADVLAGSPDVYLTLNHDESRVLARTTSGTLRLFDEDRGLRFEADLGDGPTAQDVRSMVSRGDLRGASFRFRCAPDGERWDDTREQRSLTRVERLVDLSLATVPAYNAPAVELRTAPPAAAPTRQGSLRVEMRSALSTGTERRTAVVLGREDRMSEWQAERRTRSTFTDDDARHFSLGRAVRGMVTGDWSDAELEQRALAEGVDSMGGFVTPEQLSAQVIDRIRAQAQVLNAGATTVPMDSDKLSIPRLAGQITAQWKVENAPVVESDPSFERVSFEAHTLPVLTRISMELFEDMSAAAADRITQELTSAVALGLDWAALYGTGVDPEPLGLRNQPGVELRPVLDADGAAAPNGAHLYGYAELIRTVAAVRRRNVNPNAAIYSPRTAENLALLTDTTGQSLQVPPYLRDVAFLESTQVRDDQVVGTSNDASDVFVGRWSDLLIGVRPSIGVRVRQLNERYADNMQVGLLAWIRADVQVAHPESFEVLEGVTEWTV